MIFAKPLNFINNKIIKNGIKALLIDLKNQAFPIKFP
jgi:hypothetical protein